MFHEELIYSLKARTPCIWVRTTEEKEAVLAIKNAIDGTEEYENAYTWSMGEGIKQIISKTNTLEYADVNPNPALSVLGKMISEANNANYNQSRVFVLKDYHLVLNSPQAIRLIRDVKESPVAKYVPIIVVSPSNEIPMEFQSLFKVLEYDLPKKDDIANMCSMYCRTKRVSITTDEANVIGERLHGFTRAEILNMLNLSIAKYGVINLDIINQNKIEIIKGSGVLEYKIPQANLDNVGGNHKFKEWVNVVEACMTSQAREYGIPAPKGYLSVGIPGTSKTFSAEALAGKWNVPFIKLKMNMINSRFAGETERNMAKALNVAKSCAPCVLLIDEVEKALGGYKSSNSSDSGAIARAFGLVLEFLNDNDNGVFVVMTSNDVSQLPPELTRAGRLDATWYFTLPSLEEREQIFRIHLNKTGKEVSDEIVKFAAKNTDKYTGAEIELIVKNSLRRAYLDFVNTNEDKGISKDILKASIEEVIPIATSSKEQINMLQRWADKRALFANGHNEDKPKPKPLGIAGPTVLKPLKP